MTRSAPLSVLVVEEDADLRERVAQSLTAEGFAVAQARDAAGASARLAASAYDGLVVDLRLRDANGMDVLHAARARHPEIVAVALTGFNEVIDAAAAIRGGAVACLITPVQLTQVARVLVAGMDQLRLRRENAELRAQLHDRYRFDSVVGQSLPMRQVFSTLELAAPMNSSILIHGESGTGKELLARAIHHNSPRADHRFVAFNAAATPEALAEAELFGHATAGNGAIANRVGRFERAHKGTIFIDDVGCLSPALQLKLLRALQERVGDVHPIPFDARLIAATNGDLRKQVEAGAFREDLFYRLNVIPITLPPLRDRREDIPLLARHFVQKSCKSNDLDLKTLSQDAVRCLTAYAWPGNIRQLENAIEHAVAMSGPEREIPKTSLPHDIIGPASSLRLPAVAIPDEGINFTSIVSQLERELILRCLEKTGGNKRQAARLLHLSRTTLIDKVHRLNLANAGGPRPQ